MFHRTFPRQYLLRFLRIGTEANGIFYSVTKGCVIEPLTSFPIAISLTDQCAVRWQQVTVRENRDEIVIFPKGVFI